MTTDEFMKLVDSYAEAFSNADYYHQKGSTHEILLAEKYTATAAKLRTKIEEAFLNAKYEGKGITIELPSPGAGTGG